MRTKIGAGLVAATVLAGAAVAQKTWIVDASKATGYHFDDLPAAVKRASSGDVLHVKPGVYSPTTINKGLKVLGQHAIIDCGRSGQHVTFVIKTSLPGNNCVIEGLDFESSASSSVPSDALLVVQSPRSSVHIENCSFDGWLRWAGHSLAANISVVNTAGLTMRACQSKASLVEFRNSRVHCENCHFQGANAYASASLTRPSTVAILTHGGSLILDASSAQGGKFAFHIIKWPKIKWVHGHHGLDCRYSDLVAAGRTTVLSGQPRDLVGIRAEQGRFLYDPQVTMTHAGFSQTHSQRLATMRTWGGRLGGSLNGTVIAETGTVTVTVLGTIGAAKTISSYGQWWLDPTTSWIADVGSIDQKGWRDVAVRIPKIPALRGVVVGLQSLTLRGRIVGFSTPSVITLDD